ncbi:M81 family metallopeptidase [Paracoccaceae bacterium Fryx2]|nr:M81 family metallopeptidase [Paracoccaceae bacterium Fryx2]
MTAQNGAKRVPTIARNQRPFSAKSAHGEAADWDMVPILWCGAIPSAHVTQADYEAISAEIVDGIAHAGRLDGVFLDLHGAMVAEHEEDGEGALIARVRAVVGPDVPIVAALDLHGNITARMVDGADALVGFRTYPHVDMADTGRRAAVQLDTLMARGKPFASAFRRLDFLIPIAWQSTVMEPARGIYDRMATLECGFRGEWALISRDRGHAFRAILGSHFTGSWAGWPTLSWSQA